MKYKTCFKCGETKELTAFHKHSQMKDGHLNKCAVCVKKDVDAWRKKNPGCRAKEHAANRVRKGIKTRREWLEHLAKNAIGRKVSSNKYAHKRRTQTQVKDSFTEFVFEEASRLRDLRAQMTGIKWHIDHIVPINHKDACGLHVAANLQVVPATWNNKKINKNMDTFFAVAGY